MKKRLFIITVLWLALILTFGAGCNSGSNIPSNSVLPPTHNTAEVAATASPFIKDINVTEAYDIIQANLGNPEFIIIDIRTPDEFANGYIQNAVLIDFYAENFQTEIGKLDRDKTYLIYCRTANRSGQAKEMMKKMGFKYLYHMEGGITAWIQKGYPVVK